MIGTLWKFSSSRAVRISLTRPSIMSEGATMSAPAWAWESAVLASSSRVASLSTSSPARQPQWPWSVYSHRQTSVTTVMSGARFFSSRMACWTMPFFA